MSYGTAGALQTAVFQLLTADTQIATLIGGAVYDEMPPGPVSGTYVSIGEGEARDMSDKTGAIADYRFQVRVVSDQEGFATVKSVAGAVTDALVDASPALDRGRVVALNFVRARARRVRSGQLRRIDLTFRAIVEDD